MTLTTYIREHGVDKCRALFGVSEHTIRSWLYGSRAPRPKMAFDIESKTEGQVTVREIFTEAQ